MPPLIFEFFSAVSYVVAVPISITMAGHLFNTAAAAASAILSALASFGSSSAILTGIFYLYETQYASTLR